MKVGQWAEICQFGHWLPFLVTAVHDEDAVSGVAFSGQPAQVGWRRPSEAFAGVKRGDGNRQWREAEGLVAPTDGAPPPADDDLTVIPRLGSTTAEWLAGHGVVTFSDLAELLDADIAAMASENDAPHGVSAERLREWRDAAAARQMPR